MPHLPHKTCFPDPVASSVAIPDEANCSWLHQSHHCDDATQNLVGVEYINFNQTGNRCALKKICQKGTMCDNHLAVNQTIPVPIQSHATRSVYHVSDNRSTQNSHWYQHTLWKWLMYSPFLIQLLGIQCRGPFCKQFSIVIHIQWEFLFCSHWSCNGVIAVLLWHMHLA